VRKGIECGRLQATTDGECAVRESDISLICVATPSNGNGSLDMRYAQKVCEEIGRALANRSAYHVVVMRSTVLPGTVANRLIEILEQHSGLRAGADFGVCMNPEFLRESDAISDYYNPSHIVIGELDERSGDVLEQMYAAVNAPIVRTTIPMAEMLKYVCNCFHALKVAFANEIGNLSKALGIDGQELMEIFCQDRRLNISPLYLKPGFGFGGSCLPKDLRALVYRAKELDMDCPILRAVLESNQKQIQRGVELVESQGRKKVGVLGLSFKSGTDDVRESPIVPLVETLVGRGYRVQVYDSAVKVDELIGANKVYLERQLPHIASLMRSSMEEVVKDADIVVLANGSPDSRRVSKMMHKDQVLIDLVGTAKLDGEAGRRYEGICW
jgi:GDP-mannose 6-dehydrogenase